MSHSRKKNPITGWTCCTSEKKDKRICNRSIRRISKRLLESKDPDEISFPDKKEVMNIWSMGKDGKYRVPSTSEWYRKAIRK